MSHVGVAHTNIGDMLETYRQHGLGIIRIPLTTAHNKRPAENFMLDKRVLLCQLEELPLQNV